MKRRIAKAQGTSGVTHSSSSEMPSRVEPIWYLLSHHLCECELSQSSGLTLLEATGASGEDSAEFISFPWECCLWGCYTEAVIAECLHTWAWGDIKVSESLGPTRNSCLGPGLLSPGSLFAVSLAAVFLTPELLHWGTPGSCFLGHPGAMYLC